MAGLQRVRQQGKTLGRPKVSPKVESAIRTHLRAGNGILKVAQMVGCGSGTVQRVKREMAEELAEPAYNWFPAMGLLATRHAYAAVRSVAGLQQCRP
jgi:DNA invertase Pin-like site-specific DNA recombinase